jgi:hypothetical protein
MPRKNPNDKEKIRFLLFYQIHEGITYFFRPGVPKPGVLIESSPLIGFNVLHFSAIQIDIASKNKKFYIVLVFFYQVGNRLNWPSCPERRKKPRYGYKNFCQLN